MPRLDFQPSFRADVDFSDVSRSVRAGRLDPKFLYATEDVAKLWREVFLHHSPVNKSAEFARIYDEAFASISAIIGTDVWLIGLGPGTGLKEARLTSHLKRRGHNVIFSAVDVSSDLVREANASVLERGASLGNGLVGDLSDVAFLRQWLDAGEVAAPRLFTFFGMVPNLSPAMVTRLLHAILRPGDVAMCSVHLAPVAGDVDLSEAMARVFPQYNNAETLAWLKSAVRKCRLSDHLDDPVMIVSDSEGVPAFLGVAGWKSNEPFAVGLDVADPDSQRAFQLFRSLRYTPVAFENLLRDADLRFKMLAMTECREEAIWSVQL